MRACKRCSPGGRQVCETTRTGSSRAKSRAQRCNLIHRPELSPSRSLPLPPSSLFYKQYNNNLPARDKDSTIVPIIPLPLNLCHESTTIPNRLPAVHHSNTSHLTSQFDSCSPLWIQTFPGRTITTVYRDSQRPDQHQHQSLHTLPILPSQYVSPLDILYLVPSIYEVG